MPTVDHTSAAGGPPAPGRSRITVDRSAMYRAHLVRDNLESELRLVTARRPSGPAQRNAYILGCGRSGTTLLGTIMEYHPDVTYYFEPQGRWAMVDRRTDIWKRYLPCPGGALLTAEDASPRAASRRSRLFRVDTPMMIDKSPEHAFRLGFLTALDPDARIVHIVRDGSDVAKSIDQMASRDHPLLGRHRYNEWWGTDDAKWEFLLGVAGRRGYLAGELARARGDAERGLCEWLLSMHEIELQRAALGDRLLEIRYVDLLADPARVLTEVRAFVGLSDDTGWLQRGADEIRSPSAKAPTPVTEDPVLLAELETVRARYGLG